MQKYTFIIRFLRNFTKNHRMSKVIVTALLLLLVCACSPVNETSRSAERLSGDTLDSTEYAVLVIDPGFDQWYEISYSPALDRTDSYYRARNLEGVARWNAYYNAGTYPDVIDSYIDYRPEGKYGIEVNRKIYWYFLYVKKTYGIKLFR